MQWHDIVANTALAAGVVAALGWVLNRTYELGAAWIGHRRNRRAAIIRFFVDIELRIEFLAKLRNSDEIEKQKKYYADLIAAYGQRDLKFKAYGVEVSDTRSHAEIDNHLATFSLDDARLIKRVTLLDQLMTAQYEKAQSEAFGNLIEIQKIDLMNEWFISVTTLCDAIEKLLVVMASWLELQNFRSARVGYTPRKGLSG